MEDMASQRGVQRNSDLEGTLVEAGQSPLTKKAKRTPRQSRLSTQDYLVSRILHYFEESDKQRRIDSKAESAHQRDMVSMNINQVCIRTCSGQPPERLQFWALAILGACN